MDMARHVHTHIHTPSIKSCTKSPGFSLEFHTVRKLNTLHGVILCNCRKCVNKACSKGAVMGLQVRAVKGEFVMMSECRLKSTVQHTDRVSSSKLHTDWTGNCRDAGNV